MSRWHGHNPEAFAAGEEPISYGERLDRQIQAAEEEAWAKHLSRKAWERETEQETPDDQ